MEKSSCENSVRGRAPNFSADEKVCLLNIINNYKSIVENKKTDGATWRDKEHAWQRITAQFNSTSPALVRRSVQNLRTWFENQKKITRKAAAKERINFKKTGGGPAEEVKVLTDPVYNLTLDIVNKKTIFGLNNNYDGDKATSLSVHESGGYEHYQEDDLGDVNQNDDHANDEICEAIRVEFCNDVPADKDADKENNNYNGDVDWGNFKAPNLQLPINPKLKQTSTPHVLSHQTTKKDDCNWMSRRRPTLNASTSVARKYEEVADLKIAIYQEQLRKIRHDNLVEAEKTELDKQEKEKVRKQEDELFQLRKDALDLDVQIKRAQLEHLTSM